MKALMINKNFQYLKIKRAFYINPFRKICLISFNQLSYKLKYKKYNKKCKFLNRNN